MPLWASICTLTNITNSLTLRVNDHRRIEYATEPWDGRDMHAAKLVRKRSNKKNQLVPTVEDCDMGK